MISRQWHCRVCYVSPPRTIGDFRSRYLTSLQLTAKEPGNWMVGRWSFHLRPCPFGLCILPRKAWKDGVFRGFLWCNMALLQGNMFEKEVFLPLNFLFHCLYCLFSLPPSKQLQHGKTEKHVSRLTQNISHGKLPQVFGITKGVTFFFLKMSVDGWGMLHGPGRICAKKTIAKCKVFTTSGISEPSAVLDTIDISIKATQQHY